MSVFVCELWLSGCAVVLVCCVGSIDFFFLFYRFREWFDWFFFYIEFVIVCFVIGVGRFGVWVCVCNECFWFVCFC